MGGSTTADQRGVMNYSARSQAVAVPLLALQINRFAQYDPWFTEQLYVSHLGTDGWTSLTQYNSSTARAFVLAPAPTRLAALPESP